MLDTIEDNEAEMVDLNDELAVEQLKMHLIATDNLDQLQRLER